MTKTILYLGSLSNDLARVASLTFRGSEKGANRFLSEAKRWTTYLKDTNLKKYIKNIVEDVDSDQSLSLSRAEQLLMYSVLLENYCLHNRT